MTSQSNAIAFLAYSYISIIYMRFFVISSFVNFPILWELREQKSLAVARKDALQLIQFLLQY